jgi:hypothetical protein
MDAIGAHSLFPELSPLIHNPHRQQLAFGLTTVVFAFENTGARAHAFKLANG